MLIPERVKHRREFHGRMRGEAKDGKTIAFGKYGLEAAEPYWITNRQIGVIRTTMTRLMKRSGRAWIRVFPQKSYTTKSVDVHMGSGKGAPADWVTVVRRGKIMFEIGGVSEDVAREALRFALNRLPIKTKFIKKSSEVGGESNED